MTPSIAPQLRPPAEPLATEAELQTRARTWHETNERALLPLRLHAWGVPEVEAADLLRLDAPRHVTPALRHVQAFPASRAWALVLWGGFQVGKTQAALRWLVDAARIPLTTLDLGESFRYSTSARFVRFSALAEAWRSFGARQQGLVEDAITARALVLDEVGTQLRLAAPLLDHVVCTRHLHRRPTLITTNMGRELFAGDAHFGLRVALRLEDGAGFRPCGGEPERIALLAARRAA
jgi:hypothetical protein